MRAREGDFVLTLADKSHNKSARKVCAGPSHGLTFGSLLLFLMVVDLKKSLTVFPLLFLFLKGTGENASIFLGTDIK